MTRLTYHALRRWLEGKEPDAVVGLRRDCYHCVVAHFLGEHGAPEPCVWDGSFTRDERVKRFQALPDWARRFAVKMDNQRTASYFVTAKMALETLRGITP